MKCCEEQNGCCSKREGTTLDCCFSNPIDEVDLTEDKDEEVKKNSGEENNGNDISEDVREDVKSLVDATAYTPGNNGRFTWENLKVPIPAVVKKVMAERTEEEARDGEEEEQDHVEQETTAPTGQDETRKTFKTLLDISSFKNKNEILRSALGFGIFIIVASYIVGATYTREDGREVSGNARGWSGVREERENLYDSAFKGTPACRGRISMNLASEGIIIIVILVVYRTCPMFLFSSVYVVHPQTYLHKNILLYKRVQIFKQIQPLQGMSDCAGFIADTLSTHLSSART